MNPTQTVDDAVRALPADVDLLAGVLPLATIWPFADLLSAGHCSSPSSFCTVAAYA